MVHAESFRIFGFAIPRDDMAAADELVDPDWVITSTHSTPADWTSLLGILGNLLWFHRTVITGCKDCSAEG